MCGICGFNWEDKKLAQDMSKTLQHRGPDAGGVYTDKGMSLGHRRLSIIDLSKAGKQPICNEDGTIWIAYNGEVYNFKEIKAELEKRGHQFKSNTDTEVIIHAYEEYGKDCLKKFNGMFAFAIWDSEKKELFIARDRLGIKPLVYYYKDRKFIFASEIKALLQSEQVFEINPAVIDRFLSHLYIAGPQTTFKDVYKLLPGHYLVLKHNNLEITKYWDVNYRNMRKSDDYYIKAIQNHLEKSVKMRLLSDVPLGAFLSGGLDSSCIVSIMRKYKEELKTFSVGFEGYKEFNENKYARLMAEHLGTDHHEINFSSGDILKSLPTIIGMSGEPFGDTSALPLYMVSKLARKHVTVTLSGDGGDELFGGYKHYYQFKILNYQKLIPSVIKKNIIHPAYTQFSNVIKNDFTHKLRGLIDKEKINDEKRYLELISNFNEEMKKKLYAREINRSDMFRRYKDIKFENILQKIQYLDIKTYLPGDILTKVDMATMAVSLESRVPILDHNLVELAATIPISKKFNHTNTKIIFKKAIKDYLPNEILKRKKHGFSVPISYWFKGELGDHAEQTLLDKLTTSRGLFNKKYINKILRDHKKGVRNYNYCIWTLMTLELWFRKFLDNNENVIFNS